MKWAPVVYPRKKRKGERCHYCKRLASRQVTVLGHRGRICFGCCIALAS